MLEDMTDKDLEDQLLEAGRKLLKLPSSAEDVLSLLEKVDSCLSRVEQSPSKSMQNAYAPAQQALATSDLLRHPDMDVKVYVASCVSEITRITAPEAPYTDDQMKQIFKVIVEAFEMLWDTSSRSYLKRVSILETVAKVRSCVVMLDLECDDLILDMFQHFLKAVRDDHPENVFTSMETIMSLVLEESEEIAPELLYPLLASLKKDNHDTLPVARKLAEKVLENCRPKLKPYLMETLKSLRTTPGDYSKIVGSICQVTADTTEHNDDSVSGEHVADDRSASGKVVIDELAQVSEELKPEAACPVDADTGSEKSAINATSNGDAQNLKDDPVGIDSPEKKDDDSLPAPEVPQDESDKSETKIDKPETGVEQLAKRKRGRPKHLSNTSEASGKTKIDIDKEPQSEDQSIIKSGPENESVVQAPPDEPRVERRGRPRKKKETNETIENSASVPKQAISSEKNESDAPLSADVLSKGGPNEESEGREKTNRRVGKKIPSDKEIEKNAAVTSDSEGKPLKKSGKKLDARGKKDEESSQKKKKSGVTSDSEEKPLRRSGKKLDPRGAEDEESSPKSQGEKPKKGKTKSIIEKDLPGESSKKKKASSGKSSEKSTGKNQKPLEETPTTKSKRKRGEKEGASEEPSDKDLGKNLTGSKIKVFWPEDEAFYEGTVDSYDASTKKHKVLYDDGDVEVLFLKEERWELVKAGADGGKALDFSSPDVPSEMPKRKKAKANADSASKQAKTDNPGKKEKGASTSKAKESATRKSKDVKVDENADEDDSKAANSSKAESGGKSKGSTPKSNTKGKDEVKSGTKAKTKTGDKSKEATPKAGSQSKDATPKSSKSKDATPKSEGETAKTKSKSKKTSKAGSKSGANGTPAKGKSQESEGVGKGKLLESPKTPESETKTGKKRRRVDG